MKDVCHQFLYPSFEAVESREEEDESSNTQSTVQTKDNFDLTGLEFNDSQDEKSGSNTKSLRFKVEKQLDYEITYFSNLLSDENFIKKTKSTAQFWDINKKEMPNLFELQIIILNISAGSSFIERFFSISGIVCDIKRASINDELIEMLSLMKENMQI